MTHLTSRKAYVSMGLGPAPSIIFLTCENCGSSWRLGNFLVQKLAEQNAANRNFQIRLQGIELLGTCSQCGETNNAERDRQ